MKIFALTYRNNHGTHVEIITADSKEEVEPFILSNKEGWNYDLQELDPLEQGIIFKGGGD